MVVGAMELDVKPPATAPLENLDVVVVEDVEEEDNDDEEDEEDDEEEEEAVCAAVSLALVSLALRWASNSAKTRAVLELTNKPLLERAPTTREEEEEAVEVVEEEDSALACCSN